MGQDVRRGSKGYVPDRKTPPPDSAAAKRMFRVATFQRYVPGPGTLQFSKDRPRPTKPSLTMAGGQNAAAIRAQPTPRTKNYWAVRGAPSLSHAAGNELCPPELTTRFRDPTRLVFCCCHHPRVIRLSPHTDSFDFLPIPIIQDGSPRCSDVSILFYFSLTVCLPGFFSLSRRFSRFKNDNV